MGNDRSRTFAATVTPGAKRGMFVPIPFDPDDEWGPKARHHVTGTINGHRVRAVIETVGGRRGITVGSLWREGLPATASADAEVTVVLEPEGPQRQDLAPDIADALAAEPEAGAFFDSLAQFYRRGYLRWIDATTRRPDVRVARIAEMVELCKRGVKERPRG